MLHNVYLYGQLGNKYGSRHVFDIENAPQAARALAANFKDFYRDFKDGLYQVIIGNKDDGVSIDHNTLDYQIGHNKDLHIIPVLAGSKGGAGIIKTVVGVALIVGSFFGGGPYMFNIGLALTFSGVATMLTPTPKVQNYDSRQSPDTRASFLFNGPTNKNTEGSAIPIVYGRMRVGSVVISAGINVEQV